MRYTFGDDAVAVRRLQLVADAYEPTSRAFLTEHAARRPDVAVDLGCGPGFSTRLLGGVCRPRTLIGIDSSGEFLDEARTIAPQATFAVLDLSHEAAVLPAAQVVYARLLLAHLPDPLAAVERWRGALSEGGVLLLEDLDRVEAPRGPLRAYEELSARIVRSGGGVMYGGRAVEALGGALTPVTVPVPYAAGVYLLNVERWSARPELGVSQEELAELAAGLESIEAGSPTGSVSWVVRQVVVEAA